MLFMTNVFDDDDDDDDDDDGDDDDDNDNEDECFGGMTTTRRWMGGIADHDEDVL